MNFVCRISIKQSREDISRLLVFMRATSKHAQSQPWSFSRESVWAAFGPFLNAIERLWKKRWSEINENCFIRRVFSRWYIGIKAWRNTKEAKTQRSFTPTFSPKMIDRIIQLRLFVLFAVDSKFRLHYIL